VLRRIDKLFIRNSLFWLPLTGSCFRAPDDPIMKQKPKEFYDENFYLKGTDREDIRKACEKYKNL